ncbi:MAG: hypothetical protein KIS78_13635 [Labilithrix sp.]|nr:hypothetical protein [Labilithrix sp.]
MLPLRHHEAPAPRLVIAAGAEWFQISGRAPVVLETRVPLRRLLLALGELKLRSPNAVLPVTAAFEAGWPGERASPTAAAMRVYTAVHSLRRLGLRGLLVRRRRGYVLDIDVQLAASQSQFPRALEPAEEHEDMAHSA